MLLVCRMLQCDSWQSRELFIPHKAVIVSKPLCQPHNKYRCWHTDSTSHGSRQFVLWVDWIWTPCPHLTPSNYTWQMLGACTRTLILCGKESNFHIWHWAFLPPPSAASFCSLGVCDQMWPYYKFNKDAEMRLRVCLCVCVCMCDRPGDSAWVCKNTLMI